MATDSNNPVKEAKKEEGEATAIRSTASTFGTVKFSLLRWWMRDVIGTVNQSQVIEKRREDCLLSERYLFMTAMSAGIAVLGLLLSSPAVVIGAMLLSPLMGPIMGLGFALAIGDYQWLKQSARSLAWGSVMGIALTGVLVYMSPIQTITPEIAARTQPNLFDLFVALFSALAGAYAMIRGREGTIVGVAIATALMPPLAVVGFGLATWNWTVFSGALLLYVTNLITIALTAWAMARLYGFKTTLSHRQTQYQNFMVIAVFIGLAIPLALSLQQIAFQTNSQRIIRGEIEEPFMTGSEISRLDVDFRAKPIAVSASIYTPSPKLDAETEIERALANRLGQPVELSLTQFQVGTSASAAEQAQLSATRESEEADAQARATDLAQRLALVAGVPEDDVLIDRTRRKALVRAEVLEGATLAAYKALEQRISATEPEWDVELLPPAGRLPAEITFGEDGPTPEGSQALSVVQWAASRVDLPIVLVGNATDAQAATELLVANGVEVSIRVANGPLRAEWAGPGE
ncbi:TIGR00341 family protein [Erythrobacter sp. F6033]|uniref:TIGR00341 family protein n=1 Tax=Erythrobacter sp. F6033 TaxID=2926401 RepID=UPI001FF2942A|nr:TIGR00341 family protein [Erythrobacter sp. F6033]MCK0129349.1 TIGR00341 family protein [Erythrobacter sp. F6033]